MPITTLTNSVTYAGDGSATAFAIPFPYQLQTDIVVDAYNTATLVTTRLTRGVNYSIVPTTNSPANTGTVIAVVAPAVGIDWIITRETPLTQLTSWVPNDPNLSTSTMNAVDKLTMALQDEGAIGPTDAALGSGSASVSTFLRGDRTWANTLVGPLGAFAVPTDTQDLLTVGQSAAAGIRIIAGVDAGASLSFGNDGSANAWDMRLTYDPVITAWGWQTYGGPLLGTFGADGNVAFDGDLSVTGTTDSALFTGAADASLITTGTLGTARLGSGSATSNTFLRGDRTWAVVAGGGGGINTTTTGTFVIAAVNSTQTVPVTSVTGIVVGTDLQVSDGTHLIIGLVTAIASLNLTVKTQAIALGSAGNTMASGAAVQSSTAPGNNTIQVADITVSPTTASVLTLTTNAASTSGSLGSQVLLYVDSVVGGNATLKGTVNYILPAQISHNKNGTGAAAAALIGIDKFASQHGEIQASTNGSVPQYSSGSASIVFGLITPTNITAASLTPALLNVTNALTDKSVFTYDSASGHFKMTTTAALLPTGGTAGNFVRGDATCTNVLDISASTGNRLVLAQGEVNGDFAATVSCLADGTAAYWNLEKKVAGTWGGAPSGVWTNYVLGPGNGGTLSVGNPWTQVDTLHVEAIYAPLAIRTDTALRSVYGPLSKIYTITAPAASLTVDLVNGSYQRLQAFANNVSITLADTTPLPSNAGLRYAGELTLEINAPGSFTVTFPGTITWAGGASAPTVDTAGVSLVRLVRRQGQTQWLGYVDTVPAGAAYTDGQARAAVFNSAQFVDSGTLDFTVTTGSSGSMTGIVKANSIGNTEVAAGLQASKLQGYPTDATKYLNGNGGWTVPSSGGGGGGATILAQTANGSAIAGGPFTTIRSKAGAKFTNAGGNVLAIEPGAPYYFVPAPTGVAATDTAAITTAYALAAAAGGGTIVLQAGQYWVNATLVMNVNCVSVIGAGAQACDSAGVIGTAGTQLFWKGAAGGTMIQTSTTLQDGPAGFTFAHFSLYGGATVAAQAGYGITMGTTRHCAFRNLALSNFSACALYVVGDGNDSSALPGTDHNTFDNIVIDVGTLYWQTYNATHLLTPATAVGVQLDSTNGLSDAFCCAFNNIAVVHNYVGVWLGNSDSNTITNLQCYGYPNSIGANGALSNTWSGSAWVPVSGNPQRGVYVTDNSRINRIYGCTSPIVAHNVTPGLTPSVSVFDVDFIDGTTTIVDAINVGSGCEITVTNSYSVNNARVRAGTYYWGPNSTNTTGYSIVFNDSTGKIEMFSRNGGGTPVFNA